ncbi:hypothetical protein XFEB_01939 [Xylella fastidiosa EB92.1]|nr:hypothetical protein XFEB_01939 [Xylella fastidiosa EB92.1]
MYHVDKVVHYAAFAAHDEVKVAKPNVKINDCNFLAASCQSAGQACAGSRFANAALAGSDYDNFSQRTSPDTFCGEAASIQRSNFDLILFQPDLDSFTT